MNENVEKEFPTWEYLEARKRMRAAWVVALEPLLCNPLIVPMRWDRLPKERQS